MRLVEQSMEYIAEHEKVSIGFVVNSYLSLEHLRRGELREIPIVPRWKDYDDDPEAPVSRLAQQFNTEHWAILAAFEGEERVGGAVVACDTPGLDLLEGRRDLCVLLDIRVSPRERGLGIGRRLFETALEWGRRSGCTELKVETQDVNVGACRFYSAMGCHLDRINEHAYPHLDEVQLFWKRDVWMG